MTWCCPEGTSAPHRQRCARGISVEGCQQLISHHGPGSLCLPALATVGKIFLLTSDFFQSEKPRKLRQTKTTKIPSKIPAKSLESNG